MANRFFPKQLTIGLLGLSAIAVLGACQQPTDTSIESTEPTDEEIATDPSEETTATEPTDAASGDTIVDVASGDESFSTLTQAIEAAGLSETLSAEGPYTVFAPTNEAFEALPEGTLDQLLQPENQETLAQVLTYHVLPGEVTSSDITPGQADTAAGSPLTITVDDASGEVMVNEAAVVQPDVEASNGVIHAIDQVLLPPDVQL